MATKKTTKVTKTPKPTAQKELIAIMVISILLGLGGGYALGVVQEESTTTLTTMSPEKMTHAHGIYDVSTEQAPKVELVVTEDAKSGYNVKIVATDFIFTPESVNGDNVVGEGHAHLYVDGQKIGRLYSPYYHYDGSFEGAKEFRVTLNTNDHSEYSVDGAVISATTIVTHDSTDPNHNDSHMMDDGMKNKDDDDKMHSNM